MTVIALRVLGAQFLEESTYVFVCMKTFNAPVTVDLDTGRVVHGGQCLSIHGLCRARIFLEERLDCLGGHEP